MTLFWVMASHFLFTTTINSIDGARTLDASALGVGKNPELKCSSV
ncbi:MAG: hypothetical protein ACKVX7_20530 [Planctomycetota bacterium]